MGRGGRRRDADMNSYFMSKIKSLESEITINPKHDQMDDEDDLIKDEPE